jgi:hypothetical protein
MRRPDSDNSLEHTGEAMLDGSGARKYDVLIKLHDHPRDRGTDWAERLAPLLDDHTKLVTDFDVVPYLLVADLLITDASSVSNEYALLDRPMVFLESPAARAMQRKGRARPRHVGPEGWRGRTLARRGR